MGLLDLPQQAYGGLLGYLGNVASGRQQGLLNVPSMQMAGDVIPLRPATILPGLVGPEGRTIDLGYGQGMHVAPPLISPGQYPFMPDTEPSLQWLLRHGAGNEASLYDILRKYGIGSG